MSEGHTAQAERLIRLVTTSPGQTTPALRAAVLARARRLVFGEPADPPSGDAVPGTLSPYVESILRHAYRITDQDVEALKRTYSDDVIFETTVNAAVAAGTARLERSLALLKGGDV